VTGRRLFFNQKKYLWLTRGRPTMRGNEQHLPDPVFVARRRLPRGAATVFRTAAKSFPRSPRGVSGNHADC
jgi:hypothetical protein